MQQFILLPVSLYKESLVAQSFTKQEFPANQTLQHPTYQIDSREREKNKKLSAKAGSSVDKILPRPRFKLSGSLTSILDGVKTGFFLLQFAQQLRRKNANIPDVYFTLFDAARICPTLILNQNAKADVFQNKNARSCKKCRRTGGNLWVCAQFVENQQRSSIKGETVFTFRTLVHKIHSGHA